MSAVATMPQVRGRLTPEAPLAPLVWFKSGGNAEWLFEPKDEDDLVEFSPRARAGSAGDGAWPWLQPHRPRRRGAGHGGSPRQAVREDRAAGRNDAALRRRGERILVSSTARDHGIAGLEFLRGIPGTVGGFVRMNGGAYGREVSDILVSARLVLRSGEVVEWPLDKLGYTYRHSEVPEGAVVIEARFRGTPGDPKPSAPKWTRSPAPARNRSP